jgi:hypothetical protein
MCSILFAIVYAFASFLWELSLPLKQALALVEKPPLRRLFCPLIVDWGVVLTFVLRGEWWGQA